MLAVCKSSWKSQNTGTFLKINKHLIVTKSDKGNKTVILTKDDYLNISRTLLNDTKFYAKLDNNPTDLIEKKHNDCMKYFQQKNVLTSNEAKSLKHYNSTTPLYYGLPKIHKENIPLRPIISCINSPTRGLSLFFFKITFFFFYNF